VTLKVVAEGWQVELFIWSLTHAATYLVGSCLDFLRLADRCGRC
jgi:hypothetical protein